MRSARSLVAPPASGSPASWGATHVLAYEKDGKMVEVVVRKDRSALYTAEEWTGKAVPDWTFEDEGGDEDAPAQGAPGPLGFARLYYCGEDFCANYGKATLRPLGKGRLKLDAVLALVDAGVSDAWDIAETLMRSVEEIETSLATLERLGEVRREDRGDGERLALPTED